MSILHITIKLVKPLQNNLTALIYSLVYGFIKISTASLKLILDAEQSGGFCGSWNFDPKNVSVVFPIYFVG